MNHVPVTMYTTRILDLVQKRDIASDDYIAKVLMDYGTAVLAANAIAAAPQPQIVVTDEMCERVSRSFDAMPIRAIHREYGRDMIAAVQSELGPQLGLVQTTNSAHLSRDIPILEDKEGPPGRSDFRRGPITTARIDVEMWTPGRWWRVLGPEGKVWCETSVEKEARARMRPGDKLERLMVLNKSRWEEQE